MGRLGKVWKPMHSTPLSLLERLRKPEDGLAWSQFVRLYTPLLYRWARGEGLSEADAADLLQDVFTTLLQEMPRFVYQPGKSFRGWMRTILLNRWRTLQRRRSPRLVSSEELDRMTAVDPELPGEAEERRELVHRGLTLIERDFEPMTWQAFQQTVVIGRRPAEVAAELGLTVNAVYLARARVLRRLREELAGLID
jgi:RNA polymerase sigma-70 factor (ECF subfamily)